MQTRSYSAHTQESLGIHVMTSQISDPAVKPLNKILIALYTHILFSHNAISTFFLQAIRIWHHRFVYYMAENSYFRHTV